jgi:hypothetical protein
MQKKKKRKEKKRNVPWPTAQRYCDCTTTNCACTNGASFVGSVEVFFLSSWFKRGTRFPSEIPTRLVWAGEHSNGWCRVLRLAPDWCRQRWRRSGAGCCCLWRSVSFSLPWDQPPYSAADWKSSPQSPVSLDVCFSLTIFFCFVFCAHPFFMFFPRHKLPLCSLSVPVVIASKAKCGLRTELGFQI